MPKYLSIDVGGTNIKYACLNEEGVIGEKGEIPTPHDIELDRFLLIIKEIYQLYEGEISAVVMSAPGKIDSMTGYFYTSGVLHCLNGMNLKDKVKDYIPVPFAVENDAKSAALAEIWKGSMKGIKNGIVMTLGTGIGGAVIVDGKLYRGATFAAGEFSCIPMRLDQQPYDPEIMWARPNSMASLCADYAQRIGVDSNQINGRILFEKANQRDPNALAAIRNYCSTLAAGIISLQFALDVEKISIGGGISKQPLLLSCLNEQIHLYYDKAAKSGMPASIPEITACTFHNDANMIGALYHYLYELNN